MLYFYAQDIIYSEISDLHLFNLVGVDLAVNPSS